MSSCLSKESRFVSAVIYVDDVSPESERFVRAISNILNERFNYFEIICVLDIDSKEKADIKRLTKDVENVSLIHMGIKQGIESSMKAGMNLAVGDYVFEFDSTFKDFDDSLVWDVYKKALEGYDVVGAKLPKSSSRLESRFFYRVFNTFSHLNQKIGTERFRIVSRRAINKAESYGKTIPYRKVVYLACGLKVSGIEYKPQKMDEKRPKDAFRRKTAVDSLLLFTDVAYKVSMLMSIVMAILMLFFLCVS